MDQNLVDMCARLPEHPRAPNRRSDDRRFWEDPPTGSIPARDRHKTTTTDGDVQHLRHNFSRSTPRSHPILRPFFLRSFEIKAADTLNFLATTPGRSPTASRSPTARSRSERLAGQLLKSSRKAAASAGDGPVEKNGQSHPRREAATEQRKTPRKRRGAGRRRAGADRFAGRLGSDHEGPRGACLGAFSSPIAPAGHGIPRSARLMPCPRCRHFPNLWAVW